jgi:hypothetical protein
MLQRGFFHPKCCSPSTASGSGARWKFELDLFLLTVSRVQESVLKLGISAAPRQKGAAQAMLAEVNHFRLILESR